MERSAVVAVLAGGEAVPQFVPEYVRRADLVVAADSGLDLGERIGLAVGLVVGDLDSVSVEALARARASGARVEQHPSDKDETDLELALDAVWREVDSDDVVIAMLGGAGGRLDHLLANLAVLTSARHAAASVVGYLGTDRVDVIRSSRVLAGAPGLPMSILAWHGGALGVTTNGLRWPMHDAPLESGSALGTSNEFVGRQATVAVRSGVVTAIVTGIDESIEDGVVIR